MRSELKRREALAQLDSLAQSIFIEMFGDPSANSNDYQIKHVYVLSEVASKGITRRRLNNI